MRRGRVAFAALVLVGAMSVASCGPTPGTMFEVLDGEQTAEDSVPENVMTLDGTIKELPAKTSQHLLDESGFGYFAVETESGDVCLYVAPLNHPDAQLGTFQCQPMSAIKSNSGLRVGFSYKGEDGRPYYTHAILLPDNATSDAVPGGYERVGPNLALGPTAGDE